MPKGPGNSWPILSFASPRSTHASMTRQISAKLASTSSGVLKPSSFFRITSLRLMPCSWQMRT
eukprot:CAMPEP_0183554070 /NCGR_PEP_ID=MMETSP0371-20130417/77083_1 /TAXON_ID=268820 /ORGANISM="Peridinium aciculiferum, Strain PAER-2" /LENGTH=62 /DNA_ID=CAMNT_0025759789 /DNA_START=91 /DNA_END=275 /DNA_ORIENTATION=-